MRVGWSDGLVSQHRRTGSEDSEGLLRILFRWKLGIGCTQDTSSISHSLHSSRIRILSLSDKRDERPGIRSGAKIWRRKNFDFVLLLPRIPIIPKSTRTTLSSPTSTCGASSLPGSIPFSSNSNLESPSCDEQAGCPSSHTLRHPTTRISRRSPHESASSPTIPRKITQNRVDGYFPRTFAFSRRRRHRIRRWRHGANPHRPEDP